MKVNTSKEMDILPHENIISLVVDLDLESVSKIALHNLQV